MKLKITLNYKTKSQLVNDEIINFKNYRDQIK